MSKVQSRRSTQLPPPPRVSSRRSHPWNRDRPNERPPTWETGSSYSRNSDDSIFKGAEILRSHINRQQREAEHDIILRGAATVKAQLSGSERPSRRSTLSHSSDEWSDPWEKQSSASRGSAASRTPPSDSSGSGFNESFGSPNRYEEIVKDLGITLDQESSFVRVRQFDDSSVEKEKVDKFLPRGSAKEWERRTSTPHLVTPEPRYHGDEAEVQPEEDSEYDEDTEEDTEDDEEELTLGIDEEFAQYAEESDERSFPLIMRDMASEWTDSSATTGSTEGPPPPPDPILKPPPPPPDDGTPVTQMGRDGSLRLKIVTYNVQRTDEITDDDTYSNDTYSNDTQSNDTPTNGTQSNDGQSIGLYSSDNDSLAYSASLESPRDPTSRQRYGGQQGSAYDDQLDAAYEDEEDEAEFSRSSSYIPQCLKPVRVQPSSPKGVSPLSIQYAKLLREPAYLHAQRSGCLWQTLVAQHVRFPTHWWDGSRSPQMGMLEDYYGNGKSFCDWQYIARHRIRASPTYKKLVRNRAAPGRLLLHIVVRDLMTYQPVQDIAIGCFHPNARGIRRTDHPERKDEDFRELWMAVRKRSEDGAVSVVDRFLTKGKCIEDISQNSPLGYKPSISNLNMRAVSYCCTMYRCCAFLFNVLNRIAPCLLRSLERDPLCKLSLCLKANSMSAWPSRKRTVLALRKFLSSCYLTNFYR